MSFGKGLNNGQQRERDSRFVWANGRAAGIGTTIPVCSTGRLPLLEPLPSLPNIEWKRRQSFRNKMAEAANETSFEECFFFFKFDICVCCQIQIFVFILGDKIAHSQIPFWGGKYSINSSPTILNGSNSGNSFD